MLRTLAALTLSLLSSTAVAAPLDFEALVDPSTRLQMSWVALDTSTAQLLTLTEGKDWIKTGGTLEKKAEGTYQLDVLPNPAGNGWVYFALDTSTGQLWELGYGSFTTWGKVGNPIVR